MRNSGREQVPIMPKITFNVRFYQRYGKHMVNKYRAGAQKRLGPDFFSAR